MFKFSINKAYLLIFLFAYINSFFSQQDQIDSLKSALESAKHDTTRCSILFQLIETAPDGEWEKYNEQLKNMAVANLKTLSNLKVESIEFKKNYFNNISLSKYFKKYLSISLNNEATFYRSRDNVTKALELLDESLKIQEETGDKKGISQCLHEIGMSYESKGDLRKALEYFNKSLRIREEIGDKRGIDRSLNHIEDIYERQGNIPKALEYYAKCLKIEEAIGDKEIIATTLSNIGLICSTQGNISEALEYYDKSLKIREAIGDKDGIANSFNNIGFIYNEQGNIPQALIYYAKCLKIREEIGDRKGVALSLHNIGFIYDAQSDTSKALEYYSKSLKIRKEIGDKLGIASTLNNIGKIYGRQGDTVNGLKYYTKSLKMFEEIDSKHGIAVSLVNIGSIYNTKGDIAKALEYYKRSLKIFENIDDKQGIAYSLNFIGFIYYKQKNYNVAIEYCSKSIKLSKELGFPENIKNAATNLSQIYKATGDHKKALENYQLYIQMRDSISNIETKKASIKNQLKYEYDKKALADSIQLADTKKLNKAQMAESAAKLKQQKTQRFALLAGLALVLIFLAYTYKRFLHSNKQKILIEQQKKVVDKSQKKIMDSINYAKKIQHSILPSGDKIGLLFPNHYIFFKPKDIVSGDFYWFHHHDNLSFIAVADCTGHGVPGAFMTMIASSALNEVVIEQKNTEPDKILSSLHSLIFKSLQQHKGDENSQDGMDISLAVIDHDNKVLHFSGAHNHGFLIDNGETRTLKATSKSIGGLSILGEIEPQRNFKTETYQLSKDTVLVLSTDGIYDQLNSQDEKFGIQRFKELILKLNSDNYLDNQNVIEQTYNNWRQEAPQLDDVLLLTIKL